MFCVSPPWSLISTDPLASWQSLLWWSVPFSAGFSSESLNKAAHGPVHAAAPRASMFSFWPCWKGAGGGGGAWGCVYEASAVRSDAQASTFTPHGLADSPRAPSRPASPAHGKGPQVSCILNPLYCTFTAPFLCLDMFRYTDPYHCVTVARSNLQRPASTAA